MSRKGSSLVATRSALALFFLIAFLLRCGSAGACCGLVSQRFDYFPELGNVQLLTSVARHLFEGQTLASVARRPRLGNRLGHSEFSRRSFGGRTRLPHHDKAFRRNVVFLPPFSRRTVAS